ncbi:protein of unknown function [Rhodovastum atsumiense]|nr:protein of unknown function [Rhodovastum atsumiense]
MRTDGWLVHFGGWGEKRIWNPPSGVSPATSARKPYPVPEHVARQEGPRLSTSRPGEGGGFWWVRRGQRASGADQTHHAAANRRPSSKLSFWINRSERINWLISGKKVNPDDAVRENRHPSRHLNIPRFGYLWLYKTSIILVSDNLLVQCFCNCFIATNIEN